MLRYRLQKYGFLIFLVFLCGSLVLDGCTHDSSEECVKIIQPCGSCNFNVSSGNLGTSAKGTVLIYEKEKSVLGIRIISFISVGLKDFGGVAFYLPVGCVLDDVLCTYLESTEKTKSDSQVVLWSTTSDRVEFNSVIEIGRDHSYKPTGGGNGTVVVDATFICNEESEKVVNALKFGVECGAGFENGNVIMGVAGEDVVVDIKRID